MGFGPKYINKPTPGGFVLWLRIYTVIAGSLIGWLPTASFVPETVSEISTSLLGVTLAICHGLLPLVGVEVKNNSVQTKDVDVINQDAVKMIVFLISVNVFLYSL